MRYHAEWSLVTRDSEDPDSHSPTCHKHRNQNRDTHLSDPGPGSPVIENVPESLTGHKNISAES